MSEQPKQYGVTPPITVAGPTDKELERNQTLIEELKKQDSFESQEESAKRTQVLVALQSLTENFVRKVCVGKGMPEHIVKNSGGKIFTYGSYRLGVYGPGSDIDTLLVTPAHISRHDFFTTLPPMLQELNPPPEDLSIVPDAYVPIIKFELQGISIDLIFARLPNINSVPRDMVLNDKELLRGCDEVNLRCLNGCRVTDEILALVPKTGVFKMALRAIKLWAKRRAIYGNVIGFPGGVAWAMLVARICQLYPMAVSSVIISKFFKIMGSWTWPQPVLLKGIEDGPLNVRVWNPKIYASDRSHLMPIITPAYPSMCATHNITKSTKTIIIREMARANEVVNRIMVGTSSWDSLFERHSFFTNGYRYYLSVIASAKGKEQLLGWSGLVESKLRHLVMKLEQIETIKLAHPFNRGFDKVHFCATEEEAISVAHGDIRSVGIHDGVKTAETDLKDQNGDSESKEEDDSKVKVYTTTYYIGLEINSEISKQIDISWASQEFYEMCKSSEHYNVEEQSINIALTRNYELPDDVFQAGDTKPVKQTKKKIIKKKVNTVANGNGKKRNADEKGVSFELSEGGHIKMRLYGTKATEATKSLSESKNHYAENIAQELLP
ncbi:Poly(A) polymerase central domain-containing protein [Morchella snyderi]|nr:Poly(A) polymerase central domain-containing protein [Morchella snyderi]